MPDTIPPPADTEPNLDGADASVPSVPPSTPSDSDSAPDSGTPGSGGLEEGGGADDSGLPPGGTPEQSIPEQSIEQPPIAAAPENTVSVNVVSARPADVYQFIIAVLQRDWSGAFLNANGLSMYDLLRGMATLDRLDLADLMNQQAGFADAVNLPRIQYAADTVNQQTLPTSAPGDLDTTGQVEDARKFLATNWVRPYLILPYDLTGTIPAPDPDWVNHRMTSADMANIATSIGVEVALIQAIKNVESGAPFTREGRPILRFELHLFYSSQCTNKVGPHANWNTTVAEAYARSHPFIGNARPWNWRAEGAPYHHYGARDHQACEWSYLYNAMILRPGIDNALKCASYGTHQIMGFNYARAGSASVREFVRDMCTSEAKQFERFQTFMTNSPSLRSYLQNHQWLEFANAYNGSDSAQNSYATNLANAYHAITGHQ